MPANVAERGLSLGELQGKVKRNVAAMGAHDAQADRMKRLLGTGYDKGNASADSRISRILSTERSVLGEFARQGEILADRLDGAVVLPQVPGFLLEPEGVQTMTDAKLRPIVVPSFAELDQAELSRIEDGKPSRFDNVLPRAYLDGVARGDLPLPHKDPYVLFVDAEVDSRPESKKLTTPLASNMGVQNLAHTPIAELRSTVRRRSAKALRSLGLNADEYSIKPVSAREAGLVAVVKNGNSKDVVTNTRVFGTDQHVVFGHADIRLTDGRQNGTPPRLAVINRPLRPEQYIPSKARHNKAE
ncbi:MAG: hypothetical protein H0W89_02470 [Candidatus Levybacteria bacterium]|nr:hypothetical protein [Candidatus Levybacteria bacterium]